MDIDGRYDVIGKGVWYGIWTLRRGLGWMYRYLWVFRNIVW